MNFYKIIYGLIILVIIVFFSIVSYYKQEADRLQKEIKRQELEIVMYKDEAKIKKFSDMNEFRINSKKKEKYNEIPISYGNHTIAF